MELPLLIVFLSLLFSAFFSGIEIAFISSNKLRIELQREKGALTARIMSKFNHKPSHFLSATLIGNNIALVIYGIFVIQILDPLISGVSGSTVQNPFIVFLVQTIISSMIVLITAEFLPKAMFRINPNTMLSVFSIPFLLYYYLFYPIVIFVVWLSKSFLKNVLRMKVNEEVPVFNRLDLFHFIEESSANEEKSDVELDTEIFKNALDFASLKVRDCMVPRTDLSAAELAEGMEIVKDLFTQSGHSKILIYKDTIDNIIGYVHISDMFRKPKTIESVLLPVSYTTEAMAANELLQSLIEQHRSLAVVIDEFGGTSGIITIEDVIEEIFGEIEDEHDQEDLKELQINPQEFVFSARQEIDYLNDTYDLKLPEGDYDTLGGLILHIYRNIPEPNTVIELHPYEFTILSANEAKIDEVKVKILEE